MANETLPKIPAKTELGVVPPSTPEQVAATRREIEEFLAVLAMNNTNDVLRNPIAQQDAELVVTVIDSYVANVRRSTADYDPEERSALVQRLSGLALNGVPLGYAELFTSRMAAVLDEQRTVETKDQITNDQLEAMAENVTDETVSPPRGMAIEKLRAAIQFASARLMGNNH